MWTYNTPISEDCLYLSITKPAGRRAINLPVMVSGSFFMPTALLAKTHLFLKNHSLIVIHNIEVMNYLIIDCLGNEKIEVNTSVQVCFAGKEVNAITGQINPS